MKVLFAGPSLHGADWLAKRPPEFADIDVRAPAAQGDIAHAVVEGATVIGLVDGRFEDIAAVWHKELLYALEQGVQLFGAASMGALRAAECADFGMIGVGRVFQRYRSGELEDDAAVAQLHAPAEMGHAPYTEALVNVEATLARFLELQAITLEEAERLDAAARAIFFKERTYARIIKEAGFAGTDRGKRIAELIKRCGLDQKREDALVLFAYLAVVEPVRKAPPKDWRLEQSRTWLLTLERARQLVGEGKKPGETIAA